MLRPLNVMKCSAGSPAVRWLSGRDSPGRNVVVGPTKRSEGVRAVARTPCYGSLFVPSAVKAVRNTSVPVSPVNWVPAGFAVR